MTDSKHTYTGRIDFMQKKKMFKLVDLWEKHEMDKPKFFISSDVVPIFAKIVNCNV